MMMNEWRELMDEEGKELVDGIDETSWDGVVGTKEWYNLKICRHNLKISKICQYNLKT